MEGVGFTEINPDKGTETEASVRGASAWNIMFTEINPDKGTETISAFDNIWNALPKSLQKLTPIRGRKQYFPTMERRGEPVKFTEINPDKGTETVLEE